jgi:tripartite-type tricarboxylate transporter receptor subunit TctC
VRAIVTDPEGKKRMNSLGVAVAFMGPEEFKAYMASEIIKLTAVVNDAKISAE